MLLVEPHHHYLQVIDGIKFVGSNDRWPAVTEDVMETSVCYEEQDQMTILSHTNVAQVRYRLVNDETVTIKVDFVENLER